MATAGTADILIAADSRTWLQVLAKEQSIVWAFIRRKIRIKGSPKLLLALHSVLDVMERRVVRLRLWEPGYKTYLEGGP